jgi:hypothetical protein
MNPDLIATLANIGEIIAAILVVISLGYVAMQIRQNTQALKVTATQSYVEMYNTITSELVKPEIADIWSRGFRDFSALNRTESVQFSAIAGQLMRVFESAHAQWKRGALEAQLWEASERTLSDSMTMAGFRQWWDFRKHWYSKDFQVVIDGLDLDQAAHAPYPDMVAENE